MKSVSYRLNVTVSTKVWDQVRVKIHDQASDQVRFKIYIKVNKFMDHIDNQLNILLHKEI